MVSRSKFLKVLLLPCGNEGIRILDLLDSIVRAADQVIRSGEPALTLRFSHDSSVATLAYLMGLKETQGCTADVENLYKRVSIDKIIPMAANIQLVFYRKAGSEDILVKFLLNENESTIPVKTDVSPYYHWSDVKASIRDALQHYVYSTLKRSPMILPIISEI